MRRFARELEVGDQAFIAGRWRRVTRVESTGGFMRITLDEHVELWITAWDRLRVAA